MKEVMLRIDAREWVISPQILVLSYEERGIYMQLLCLAAVGGDGECRLPNDDTVLARLLGLQVRQWRKAKAALLNQHFPVLRIEGGFLTNDLLKNTRRTLTQTERPSITEWRELKEAVFERDNRTCQYCGAHDVPLECDHVIPLSRGGTNDLANLATACVPCNRSKGGKLLAEWQEARMKVGERA